MNEFDELEEIERQTSFSTRKRKTEKSYQPTHLKRVFGGMKGWQRQRNVKITLPTLESGDE